MPASLMSGLNHEPFRKEKFITSDAELEAKVEAIWELPVDMFKNKAVVLSGKKLLRCQRQSTGAFMKQ